MKSRSPSRESARHAYAVRPLISESVPPLAVTDAYCLMGLALNKQKEFLYSHPDHVLDRRARARWEEYKRRRISGEPCAYITGIKEFYSLVFEVNRHTLIPRPETEMLVDEVVALSPHRVLDVGTGCGNIAVAVKSSLPGCAVFALDADTGALDTARRNARRILGRGDVTFFHSNRFESLPEKEYDVIVSNPPYVKVRDFDMLMREVRDYEPRSALDGGADGLDAYRWLLEQCGPFLAEGGRLLLEIDERLLSGIRSLGRKNGYFIERTKKDLAGRIRMAVLGKQG